MFCGKFKKKIIFPKEVLLFRFPLNTRNTINHKSFSFPGLVMMNIT